MPPIVWMIFMKERDCSNRIDFIHAPDSFLANVLKVPFDSEIITPQLLEVIRNAGQTGLLIQGKGMSSTVKSTKEDLVTEGDECSAEELERGISYIFPTCA